MSKRGIVGFFAVWAGVAAHSFDEHEIYNTSLLQITSFDGTLLQADVTLPKPKSASDRFPVIIMANSWAMPQFEYILDAQHFAVAGYIVLEYEARGWYRSGGYVDVAGEKDQRDITAVISFVLSKTTWQPDPENIALLGISYGGGLALLGARNDRRVKTAVAMSGWASLERALFEGSSPNLVWGTLLMLLGHLLGKLEPVIDRMYKELLLGNESAFRDFVSIRSIATNPTPLEARQVPLFLSNNFEDRLFHPQDTLDFFETYSGPKRLLLNQGIHATAEIAGLVAPGANYVWQEVKNWLDTWLKGKAGPAPPLVDMQLRSDKKLREKFESWPTKRVFAATYSVTPRGSNSWGGLDTSSMLPKEPAAFETITFGKRTGITAGTPVVGELLQVFVDKRIKSELLLSSKTHSIWYYTSIPQLTRFCGTPKLSLDISASKSEWQIVAYLFGVDRLTKSGTLISHGSLTCWNCTSGERRTRVLELRTLCEDVGGIQMGGLGLALNLYSDMYEPANTDEDLYMTVHYSGDFRLEMPVVDSNSQQASRAAGEILV